jgi:uncharacterized protein (DUF1015 family)
VPEIRPFRALRYRADEVDDLAAVISPPYDVIGPDEQRELLARDPRNVVRLDLPAAEPGDEPEDRYRRAARTLAAWRSDGTLHKDPRPSLYVYEQTYRLPGGAEERSQRGFFGRVRLEPFGPGSGVLPHERTLAAPREDRYRLLRATGVNTSPVVALYADGTGIAAAVLATLTAGPADLDVADSDGVRHRLWVVPDDGQSDGPVARLVAAASEGPLTIADGHHRYETALRYRDERRMTRSCEEDPAFDYVLTLLLDTTAEPLTVLPTHRILLELTDAGLERLRAGLGELFSAREASADEICHSFGGPVDGVGGRGRFGLWTRGFGALLDARRESVEPLLPQGGDALRRLDVTVLEAAIGRLTGIDATAVAEGRLAFTKSAPGAVERVDRRADGADAAFFVEPTPVADVLAVARDGDVMPQKSTYFYPKAASGLVINPHEW